MAAVTVGNPQIYDPATLNHSGGPYSGPGTPGTVITSPTNNGIASLFQGVTAPTVNIPSIDTTHLYDGVVAPTKPSSLGTITYGEVASAVTQDVTKPTVPASIATPASSSSGTPWYVWLIVAVVILLILGMLSKTS